MRHPGRFSLELADLRPRVIARWVVFAASFVFTAYQVGGAEEPNPTVQAADAASDADVLARSPEQVEAAIDELRHDSFTLRQAAAARLMAAGVAAREPLLKATESPDPETRAAARRLVALIDRSEFQHRLEEFAGDTDGHRRLTLPGWDQYRELVGGDPADRALFVEMQRQEAPLLAAAFGASQQSASQLFEERLQQMMRWQATARMGGKDGPRGRIAAPLASCAALVFLGSVDEMNVSDPGAHWLANLIQGPPLHDAAVPGGSQEAVRRVVAAWVLHCPNKNEMVLAQRLTLASSFELKEALPLALAVSGVDPQFTHVQPLARAMAVLCVGQLGDRENVEQLEPLLDDTTVCIQGQVLVNGAAPSVQIRDVALAAMLQLTEQRLGDYGFAMARMQPRTGLQLQNLFLPNDEQRARAIAKWREWRKAQQAAASTPENTQR